MSSRNPVLHLPTSVMKMDKRWVIPNTEILGYARNHPVRPSTCSDRSSAGSAKGGAQNSHRHFEYQDRIIKLVQENNQVSTRIKMQTR